MAEQGLQCAGRYLELVQTPVILQEMIAWKCRELVVGARHGISLSDQDWTELQAQSPDIYVANSNPTRVLT